MKVDLNQRELNIVKKVLQEKAVELRNKPDYYQDDKVQADYFEVDLLAKKLGMINVSEDKIEKKLDKDIEKEYKKQIQELNVILKEYEKINKGNVYNFRIKGLTEHIEVLEGLLYGHDLVNEWKVPLKEDQKEFNGNIEDDWDMEM